jgi:hypothetical protein
MGPAPPSPVLDLTVEQLFKMRQIEDLAKKLTEKELLYFFLQVQKQCFILQNTCSNLLKHWPTHQATTPEDK